MIERKPARHRSLPRSLRRSEDQSIDADAESKRLDRRHSTNATSRAKDSAEGREASPQEANAYKIGYGKPPEHTRFKPGQSGNPRGRRRGARHVKTILEEALTAPVAVSNGGQKKMMRLIDAIASQLTRKGASGDTAALRLLFDLASRYNVLMEEDEKYNGAEEVSAEDQSTIEELKRWLEE